MLKTGSKRRRTKAEIADSQAADLEKENATRAKMARLDEVERQLAAHETALEDAQSQLQQNQEQLQLNEGAAVLVNDLMKAGIVR